MCLVGCDNMVETNLLDKNNQIKQDFSLQVKYGNTLPDIPFNPKSIHYPIDYKSLCNYNSSSLQLKSNFQLYTERNLGVDIDLIIPPEENSTIDPEDNILLEDDNQTSTKKHKHNARISWLRKTEYISSDSKVSTKLSLAPERKVGYNLQNQLLDIPTDVHSKILSIEKSFVDAQKPIVNHHSDDSIKPISILPIYPDTTLTNASCAQVTFDTLFEDSLNDQLNSDIPIGLLRGMNDEYGDYVGYFTPVSRHMQTDDLNDIEMVFKKQQEYTWSIMNSQLNQDQDNMFLVKRNDGYYYRKLDMKIKLTKRRRFANQTLPTSSSSSIHDKYLKVLVSKESITNPHLDKTVEK